MYGLRKRALLAGVLLVAVLAVSLPGAYGKPGGAAATSGVPGVTKTVVVLGGTMPLSGLASLYSATARGAEAYFKYVNARGGVHGRKIVYKYRDDAYNPAQTVQLTRQLVQQDRVFAIFNSLGTEHNLAVRPYLNQRDVPQLFIASGATTWGRDYKQYPWTIGFLPSYLAEGKIYGRYLVQQNVSGKIAVLHQNDDYGKELLEGLKQGLGSKASLVVSQSYEVTASDVSSQVAKLKGTGANTFLIFATPKFAIQAFATSNKLGWRPQIVVNSVANSAVVMSIAALNSSKEHLEGTISYTALKDPSDPQWASDPGYQLYRSIMTQYFSGGNLNDVFNMYGMAVAHTMVEALKRAGRNLTREAIMDAVTHLDIRNNPFVLPGVTIKTTPSERFPLEHFRLMRYESGRWVLFGPLVRARG